MDLIVIVTAVQRRLPRHRQGLNPELTLQHAMDYVASRYGATFAHHILAKAKA
jgi:hypothetical protein